MTSSEIRLLIVDDDANVRAALTRVSKLTGDPETRAIVKMIVRLTHELGMTVVAEGIETAAQFHALARMGCDAGQGYYFGEQSDEAEQIFTEGRDQSTV